MIAGLDGHMAVLGGLGAALSWSIATLAAARASREVGAETATALMLTIGLVVVAPFVLMAGVPAELDGPAVGWLIMSGACNVVGIGLIYTAFRSGLIGLISAIVATEGALTALISVAAGEPLGVALGVAIAVVTLGVVITAGAGRLRATEVAPRAFPLLLAGLAACVFAASLYATGRASDLPAAWVVLPARLIGAVAVALPLLLLGRLRSPGRAWPLLAIAGVGEVVGFASFTVGSRESIAVAAVCAAPGAVFAAIGAYLLYRERLTRTQIGGILVTVVGVAAVGALSG